MRLNDCDPGFKHEVAAEPGGAGIRACFACAACSARCPVGANRPAYDPRRIIRLTLLGRREEVLASPLIWLCSSCYSCGEVCPQQVRFTEVLTAIKNIAAREGHAPPSAKITAELLAKQGRLLEVTDFENDKRSGLGLPPVQQRPEDFQAILGLKPSEGEAGEEPR
ncbi:MAG: 4Fe-4S dicluster domain-containing protein [Desulfarculaceae bacterium]|nr:4Fe-4S dicluster domain-containing protein [Desulfarculaceae bacterium]MCF8048172.1 4Fe-4S dicluster domain-containing protein [Desulfarculaceae bacterium]MCF8096403.1 4Fe-4S dicluster domain-containing protein [Desulfarculaceae bacterium]MCF8121918.1 4Fe-4S dicluster domain-containing protein [Desulfarculaceae bacterium]